MVLALEEDFAGAAVVVLAPAPPTGVFARELHPTSTERTTAPPAPFEAGGRLPLAQLLL
jgi:hypothetical protein